MRTTSYYNPNLISQKQISQVEDNIIMLGYWTEGKENSYRLSAHAPGMSSLRYEEDMVTQEFTFKATKLSKSQKTALSNMIEEAYHLRGYLLRKMYQGENPGTLKPWLISYYSIPNGNVEVYKNISYLDVTMIGYILDDIRRLYYLVKENRVSNNIYLGLNTSEHKCLVLNQYGFSHSFIDSDIMRVMGVSQPIRLQWTEKLKAFPSIKYGPIKIKQTRDCFYITISCMVAVDELNSSKHRKSNLTFQPLLQSHSSKSSKSENYEEFIRQGNENSCRQKRQA